MNLITKLLKIISDYRHFRAAYSQMSALSDHMLADIGVSRSEIKAIASGELSLVNARTQKVKAANNARIDNISPINSNSVQTTDIRHLENFPKAA